MLAGTIGSGWRAAAIAALVLAFAAGQARAASYPAGGSGFEGGPEGWSVPAAASCTLPVGGLCSASAGYDGANGNPAGSLALNGNLLVNALGLLKVEGTFLSPDFTVKEGGSATLAVQRQIASSNVVDLAAQGSYEVTLIDRTSGVRTKAISDTATAAETAFAGSDGAVKVVAGQSYAIEIAATTSTTVANVGLLGSTALRFDNVSLTVGATGPGGGEGAPGGGGGGPGTLTSSELRRLVLAQGLVGNAVLRGKRVFVKAKCPARIGRACRVTVQGMLRKGKPATTRRVAKIGKGRARQLVLRVKPKQKAKVAKRHRLLFKQTVRAGKAKLTVYRSLKLIRRR